MTKTYETMELPILMKDSKIKILSSMAPASAIRRTPNLVYITEFLKCDGSVYLIKRKDGFAGGLIFSTLDSGYKTELKKIVEEAFNPLKTFERKDGFGLSNLSLAVLLSNKFGVPVGKKGMMEVTYPENEEEAKMILRSVIDTEGNVDDYGGSIVIGNQSQEYLESYGRVLEKWFEISTINLSPTKGWGEKTNRIGITKDVDLIKIFKIGLLNPTRQERLKFMIDSFELYQNDRKELIKKIKSLLKQPKTIRDVSNLLKLAPFVVRRLINSAKAIKVGKIRKNNRNQILWKVGF